MTPRFFSGRESWVFRAHALDELCGFHPDLVAQALAPGARVEYLLYSPLREVDGGPFDLKGPCGSHALAVTGDRVIISRDPHHPRRPRTVCQILFSDILAVELGEALTLGWLVIRFAAAGRMASEIIFFQSSGIDHFRAAVRAWRRNVCRTATRGPSIETWDHVWQYSPPYLRTQLAPLVLDAERLRAALHAAETWSPLKGRARPVCLSAAGLCAVTEDAVLLVQSERPYRPGALVFAVNVICLDHRVVRDVIALRSDSNQYPAVSLALDLEIAGVTHHVTMALGRPAAGDLEGFVAHLRRTAHASC